MENIICKSQAMKAGMEKPYVCVLAKGSSQLAPASLEVVLAKSLNEAKTIFRTLPIACFVVPLTFKGSNCPCRCNFPHFGRSIIPCLVIPSDVFKLYLIPFLPHLVVRRPSFDSLMPAMIFLQHVHSL
jgi:hypothetical protein